MHEVGNSGFYADLPPQVLQFMELEPEPRPGVATTTLKHSMIKIKSRNFLALNLCHVI
jgi:hypothetical protein